MRLLNIPKRNFYFHLEKSQKNLDFPLNVGYNDNFNYHSQYLSVMKFYKLFSSKATWSSLSQKEVLIQPLRLIMRTYWKQLQMITMNSLNNYAKRHCFLSLQLRFMNLKNTKGYNSVWRTWQLHQHSSFMSSITFMSKIWVFFVLKIPH